MVAEQDLCYKRSNLDKKVTRARQLLKCVKLSIIVAWIRKQLSATCEHNGVVVAHSHITCHVHELFKWCHIFSGTTFPEPEQPRYGQISKQLTYDGGSLRLSPCFEQIVETLESMSQRGLQQLTYHIQRQCLNCVHPGSHLLGLLGRKYWMTNKWFFTHRRKPNTIDAKGSCKR